MLWHTVNPIAFRYASASSNFMVNDINGGKSSLGSKAKYYYFSTSSSKKEAKKSAAFGMLLYVLGYEKED